MERSEVFSVTDTYGYCAATGTGSSGVGAMSERDTGGDACDFREKCDFREGGHFREEGHFCEESHFHEECGVFGISSPVRMNVAQVAYYALYALQHRGQEGAGIAVNDGGVYSIKKAEGLVGDVFSADDLDDLGEGSIAVGHVRYATTGAGNAQNVQPLVLDHHRCRLILAHNGNLTNSSELRRSLEDGGAVFHTTTDSEVIAYMIVRESLRHPFAEDAVKATMEKIEGAYSLILSYPDRLVAVRDPKGYRPLCYGVTKDGAVVFASETCALDAVKAKFVRDLLPGEIVVAKNGQVRSDKSMCGKCTRSTCVFEYIYFARPDSVIDGKSVSHARNSAGRYLAEEHPVEADIVIGVPDSGLEAALGYSAASGIPYAIGFTKNKYIGRTFISPGQALRENGVNIKLNAIREVVGGKRVVLVDDSIVRGTTSRRIVNLLRDAGAKEIHMRISSPPFVAPCYYGTDISTTDDLIATKHTTEEIARMIGVDSLGYLSLEHVVLLTGENTGFCTSCFAAGERHAF